MPATVLTEAVLTEAVLTEAVLTETVRIETVRTDTVLTVPRDILGIHGSTPHRTIDEPACAGRSAHGGRGVGGVDSARAQAGP